MCCKSWNTHEYEWLVYAFDALERVNLMNFNTFPKFLQGLSSSFTYIAFHLLVATILTISLLEKEYHFSILHLQFLQFKKR